MCKTLKLGVLTLAMLGIAFLACDKLGVPDSQVPENPGKVTASSYMFTAPLMVGQTTEVGYVGVSFTYDYIYLEYVITDPTWWITEVHAQVATTLNGIPQVNGNPQPGQFAFKDNPNPAVQSYLFTIPNTDPWRSSESLFIACHCVAYQEVGGIKQPSQTGWAGDREFPGHNWAKYFVVHTPKVLYLPRTMVHSRYSQVLGNIPCQFHVWGIPSQTPPYSMTDGYYSSFCLDRNIYIYPQDYNTYLFSSYDPSMPRYAKYLRSTWILTPYDKMNYLLNGIIEGWWETADPLPYTDAHIYALQHVFWYYRGILTWPDLTPYEQELVTRADANGVGFVPEVGQYMAVLLCNGENVQLCFIVVDP